MTALLEIKQRMKEFYAKYDIYIIPAVKFILAMAAFFTINSQIGFMEKITSPVISVLLALLCSFLPVNMIAVFGSLLMCAHAFALSMEVFAMTAGLLLIMYLLYFRVAPGQGYVLVLTPLAFLLQIALCDTAGAGTGRRSGLCGAHGIWNNALLSDVLYENE